MHTLKTKLLSVCFLTGLLIASTSLVGTSAVRAQDERQLQVLTGRIGPDELMQYTITDLRQGDTVYAYMRHTSGNLNPIMAITDPDVDLKVLRSALLSGMFELIESGVDPIEAQEQILAEAVLVLDDNSGTYSDAAFEFVIPRDGDYLLLAASSFTAETFGGYELVLGINAPEVLDGETRPTGHVIAVLDEEASEIASSVQIISGTLTVDEPSTFFTMNNVRAGDTLYAYIEATAGDLIPMIQLTDYGGALLRDPNRVLQQPNASFEYAFNEDANGFRVEISSCCPGTTPVEGDYRLVVGINEPQVLTDQVEANGRPLLRGPTEIQVGVKLQQITDVNQVEENYSAVAHVQMQWNDPELAFHPDDCQCRFKSFLGNGLSKFLADNPLIWPEFTIVNQQDRRFAQNVGMVFTPNGDASYIERFTAKLQAPDFDFTSFPFDTQLFTLEIDSLFPKDFFVYADLEGFTEVGDQLGEEEWTVTDHGTSTSSQDGSSRFTFWFEARRHINFYLIRIIIPTLLIVVVSWFTFFLQDYRKRIDATGANLLVFVAFNFTISDDLPRLGYLTFLDAFLAGTFFITAVVLLFNVVLRRLEIVGRENLAKRIDNYTIWIYPIGYAAFVLWLWQRFLL